MQYREEIHNYIQNRRDGEEGSAILADAVVEACFNDE